LHTLRPLFKAIGFAELRNVSSSIFWLLRTQKKKKKKKTGRNELRKNKSISTTNHTHSVRVNRPWTRGRLPCRSNHVTTKHMAFQMIPEMKQIKTQLQLKIKKVK
ncbi:hypothetical protein PO909_031844, partial [Leuciscus waleckii]